MATRKTAKKPKPPHPLLWIVEPLMYEPDYFERPMFGCLAIYLHGRMVLVLCSGKEPWNGLLVPTDHQFQESLLRDFAGLRQHTVLKKWLYLPEKSASFESTAPEIVEKIRTGDTRIGVEPKERKTRKRR